MCNIYISFLYLLLPKYLFLLLHDRDVQLNDYEIHIEFITFMYVYNLLVPIYIGMYRFIQYSVTHLKALISIAKLRFLKKVSKNNTAKIRSNEMFAK